MVENVVQNAETERNADSNALLSLHVEIAESNPRESSENEIQEGGVCYSE
jgi:hypothetical protein